MVLCPRGDQAIQECMRQPKIDSIYVNSCCALPSLALAKVEDILDRFFLDVKAEIHNFKVH